MGRCPARLGGNTSLGRPGTLATRRRSRLGSSSGASRRVARGTLRFRRQPARFSQHRLHSRSLVRRPPSADGHGGMRWSLGRNRVLGEKVVGHRQRKHDRVGNEAQGKIKDHENPTHGIPAAEEARDELNPVVVNSAVDQWPVVGLAPPSESRASIDPMVPQPVVGSALAIPRQRNQSSFFTSSPLRSDAPLVQGRRTAQHGATVLDELPNKRSDIVHRFPRARR